MTTTEDIKKPFIRYLAFLSLEITIEDININKKAHNINQKDPKSNITPNKDVFKEGEKIAESKTIKTKPSKDKSNLDFGKMIFPSLKRAADQDIIETTSPTTSNKLLLISKGMFVKGKKNKGNITMTVKIDQNEILSKIFDNILFYKLIKSAINNPLYHTTKIQLQAIKSQY